MDIIGKVIQVLPLQQGTSSRTGNPWTIKTIILETQESHPRTVAIEIFGDQRIQDNPCDIDNIITASVDVESHEYNGRWFTSVRAWRIQQGAVAPATPAQPAATPAAQPVAAPAPAANATFDQAAQSMGDNTDLPF